MPFTNIRKPLILKSNVYHDYQYTFRCMRTAFTILMLVLALLLASGCTSQAPAATTPSVSPVPGAVTANTQIPDMIGLWVGTGTGYTVPDGFYYYPTTTFNISVQKGQIFTGRKEYPKLDGKTYYENFSGIVTMNGEIYEADSEAGFSIGKLTAPDSLELNYLEDGKDTKAIIMHLTRQKR
jgi:hypothetical protein